jgi:hypothetical protein
MGVRRTERHDLRRRCSLTPPPTPPGATVYFYELHEGETDLFTDLLLVHDVDFDEDQFLDLVLEARAAVLESFREDTLVEAVAAELERRHGFTVVDDSRLRVSVNVSGHEGETALAGMESDRRGTHEAPEEDDEDADALDRGFRTVVVDLDRNDDLN